MFLLHDAIKVLRQNPKTVANLDGGHSRWHPVEEHARLLKMAGVEDAHGFALNTSNYRAMDELRRSAGSSASSSAVPTT